MADLLRARRVLVLGCPGSGKTTLATRLAVESGLPLHHLDDEHWGAGWARPDPRWWEDRQRELTSAPSWIIDGNYLETIPLRAANAELVVILDTGTATCLFRVIRRAWRIRQGDHSALPARVRDGVGAGHRTAATADFLPLLRKVLRFRSRDFWSVLRRAHANPAARVVIAVEPGRTRRRIHAVRERLARAGSPAAVMPVTELVSTSVRREGSR